MRYNGFSYNGISYHGMWYNSKLEIDITYSGITESDITINLRWHFDITEKREINTGCLTVSVSTLIAYFSVICEYFGISF